MAQGKKYIGAQKRFDRDQLFTPTEALGLVKSIASAEFDETVEVAVRLGVDPRKADQMVPWHRRPAVGHRQGRPRRRVRRRRSRRPGPRGRAPTIVGADDLAARDREGQLQLRRRHRDAAT